MTGLVARLAIPAPVQAAWAFIRPVAPYLIGAVLLVVAVLHFEAVGARGQAAKDAVSLAQWQAAFHQSDVNFHTAMGMVDDQTAKVKALSVESEQRAREAAAAKAAAVAANKSLIDYQKILGGVAKRNYSSAEPCSTPPEIMKGIN